LERRSGGAVLSLLGLALGLLLALPASSLAGTFSAGDFGDAPDGAKAGYFTSPGVVGHFPSKLVTPGPRHGAVGELLLGAGVTSETDSAQVNRDKLDDGVDARLSACKTSTLRAVVNASGLSSALRTGSHTAYLNAWFDWNRDGDWADPSDGCRPEWAVQNLPINMGAFSTVPIQVLPVSLTAGKRTTDIWMRVTLSLDEPVVSPIGRGGPFPYARGETEDYLLPAGKAVPPHFPVKKPKKGKKRKRKKKPTKKQRKLANKPFKVSCVPNPAVILHGAKATVRFSIADRGKGFIFGRTLAKPNHGKTRLTPKKPQPRGLPRGYKAMSGFTYANSQVDPPTRVETKTARFLFTRGKRSQRLNCVIKIVHIQNLLPPFICGGACAGSFQIPAPTQIPGPVLTQGSWNEVPIELVQLQLQSAAPVTVIKLPLLAQSPPWPGAALQSQNDPDHLGCELKPLELNGGPAAMTCTRNATNLGLSDLYAFDPFGAVPDLTQALRGIVTSNGTDYSFQVPHGP
jgi:hypothetical protein